MGKAENTIELAESADEFAGVFDSGTPWAAEPVAADGDSGDEEGICLVLEKSRTYGNGECTRVYSYQGTLLARSVLYFAKEISSDYGDEPVDEMWVELDGRLPAADSLAHGCSKAGLVSPGERSYEATLLVGGAKAAWFELRKTRVGIRFDLDGKTVIVEEFGRRFPECGNGEPCEWLYFEDAEGNLYENNRTYNTWARIWPDGMLSAMEWADPEEKIGFVGTLKPVEDAGRVQGAVSFHRDADDMDEGDLRFFAEGPDGKVREYQGLVKFQSPYTGNFILMFTNVPKRRREDLRVYASVYDPLQWRALGSPGPGRLDLGELADQRDWAEVLEIIGAEGDVATLGASATDSTCVALPSGSMGLLGKARMALGL